MSEGYNEGRIMKATGGFYYVECGGELVECRARGLFRKKEITPLVGDFARFERSEGIGYLTEILPRKNELVRPPVANLDQLVLVSAAASPAPNLPVLDKLLAIAEHKKIQAAIVFTKSDLADVSGLLQLYRGAGYEAMSVNSLSGMVDAVRPLLGGEAQRLFREHGRREIDAAQRARSRAGTPDRRDQPKARARAAHHPRDPDL